MELTRTRPVVSTKQMIPAIRHQGYHTPYALAELIDNSTQAGAKHIEVLCMDKVNIDTNTRQLQEIAILDDGSGMSQNDLWDSIRLGESQNRGKGGIGRFGVGLTHASFSQCRKLDVYSWTDLSNIFHAHLDLDSLEDGESIVINEPIKNDIPPFWRKASKYLSKSGTLVVWSTLDQCKWKKASTLITNSEFMLGRTYRKFIYDDDLKIRLVSFDGQTNTTEIDKIMLPNDPLYLMTPSSTSKPYHDKPMFQKDGDRWEEVHKIGANSGKEYDVIVRYTSVKKEAREGRRSAGLTPYGKHASNNLGLSVIRARRELNMDTHLLVTYSPTERWWGAELEFTPELDEVFGVSSNKQIATEFAYMTQQIGKQNREQQDKNDIESEKDNPLYKLVLQISARLNVLRANVERTKTRGNKSHGPIIVPPNTGKSTVTSEQINRMSTKERLEALKKFLDEHNLDQNELMLDPDLQFKHASLTGRMFFDVGLVGGVTIITINTQHKAYTSLLSMLMEYEDSDQTTNSSNNHEFKLLKKAAKGFKLFLAAWARLENETPNPTDRKDLGDLRWKWGIELSKYFEVNED